jgi:ribonuclease T1
MVKRVLLALVVLALAFSMLGRATIPPAERAQLNATLSLIQRGGPFPYKQDGSIFSNREKLLPKKPRGYYREYTVPTPGARNRGARRVVRGKAGETWYTRDHYKTFVRIDR